ncbi:MAG TPA: cytochrome c3 family protein, partial [Anaerolineae bacterium]|nr:cytochrome c3 family protein [Anaerolineae bacterium]
MNPNSFDEVRFNPSEIIERLTRSFADTLSSPSADPMQTALLGGIFLVIVAFAGILGYLIYTIIRDRKKPKLPKVMLKRPSRSLREVLVSLIVIGSLAAIAIGYGFDYVGQPDICINCHKDKKQSSKMVAKHKGIKCIRCHQKPGLAGYVVNKFDYARWVLSYVSGSYLTPLQASVDNGACLRCHREVSTKTVNRYNIRVSHKEFLATGTQCVECHANAPHRIANNAKRITMNKCISCHNNKKVSSECTLCHPNQADTNMRTASREFTKFDVKPLSHCRNCHPPALWKNECIRCHGLEMPHPPGWAEGSHARLAFENRALCDKCHPQPAGMAPSEFPHSIVEGSATTYMCNGCHKFPGPHGSTA